MPGLRLLGQQFTPLWQIAEENTVNAVVVALLLIGAPTFAFGISALQAKLECWDNQRHAQD